MKWYVAGAAFLGIQLIFGSSLALGLGWRDALNGIAASLIAMIAWRVAQRIVSSAPLVPRGTFQAAPGSVRG